MEEAMMRNEMRNDSDPFGNPLGSVEEQTEFGF